MGVGDISYRSNTKLFVISLFVLGTIFLSSSDLILQNASAGAAHGPFVIQAGDVNGHCGDLGGGDDGENQRGSALLLPPTGAFGRRRGLPHRQRLLQGCPEGTADGIRRRSTKASRHHA